MRFTPIWVTKTSRYSYPYTMSEFQTDITLRVVSISNQNLDIAFEYSFCLYLQIIITFCLKNEIFKNIIWDLRTFSVYGHGVCTLMQMQLNTDDTATLKDPTLFSCYPIFLLLVIRVYGHGIDNWGFGDLKSSGF